MANHAYLGVWCKDFSEERMLDGFAAFLATVPDSATKPPFTYLAIRAVDASEAPILEQDFRARPLDAAAIIGLAQDHLHSDSSYEVHCYWDLWVLDGEGRWKTESQKLEIFCHGEDYDSGFWREHGHMEANLGFEHFFTGHAGLLGIHQRTRPPAQSLEEARFLESMAWPDNLQSYQEKTRENIRKLLDWVHHIERAMPDGRVRLWSEGEENFEVRLEEILAVR